LPDTLSTKNCKNAFAGHIGNYQGSETEFFKEKFTVDDLEKSTNPILKLILLIFR
jgi:hypothetical protein